VRCATDLGEKALRSVRPSLPLVVPRSFPRLKRWITVGSLLIILIISSLLALKVAFGSQSTITVNVTDKSGIPLLGISVQGFMETAKAGIGATGLRPVFNGTTNSAGELVISDLSKAMAISNDWLGYQGAGAKYFSPRVLLFLTYANATGSLFFEQDSVPLTTLDFLNHQSASVVHSMDLSRPIPNLRFPKLNTQTQIPTSISASLRLQSGSTIASIPPMTLPAPPSPGVADEWFLNYTDGPYPSTCCANIPIAWGQVYGGAYADMSVSILAAQTDDLNTGYAMGNGYHMSSPTFNSGSAISSFQNSAQYSWTVGLNTCGGTGCTLSPPQGEIWIPGQIEGDDFALYGCCGYNGVPVYLGEDAYEIGIVNIPVDPSSGQICPTHTCWDYNLPSYTTTSAFGQDFYQAEVGDAVSGTGNGTPQNQKTSYSLTAQFVGNQIGWYANLALTGVGLLFSGYPTIAYASGIGGLVSNLVGPIGSINTNQAVSWWQYDAPLGYQDDARASVSNAAWQVNGMSSTGYIPLEGYYSVGYPPGGGGCVLSGTSITLANGTQIPVDNLRIGQKVLSYDTQKRELVVTTVYSDTAVQVSQVVDINNGLLYASGFNDQPVYVELQDGTQKWIELGQLLVGMKLFQPVSGTWISVMNIQDLSGHFTVYDLGTANAKINNYIANGVLLDLKQ